MTGRLGASLPVATVLGFHERGHRPPSLGNDFQTRFREDLALFAELGVTDLRLGFDWARLQPRPDAIDDDWREWYQQVVAAANGLGIGVWASLLERSLPRWFDDEGGFADTKTAGRRWPAWVERAAELFGDQVVGWFPIHDPVGVAARSATEDGSPRHLDALSNLLVAWRDAWRILQGGGPQVATSIGVRLVRPADDSVEARAVARRDDHLRWTLWLRGLRDGVMAVPTRSERRITDLAGSLDVLGIAFGTDLGDDARPEDSALDRWEDRAGQLLRRTAEDGPDRPIMVTYRTRRTDDDQRRLVIEALGRAADLGRRDGIRLPCVFLEPGIDGVDDATGPIDRDRQPKSSAERWVTLAGPAT